MCEPHDSTGEPGAGNRHAGFGERGEGNVPMGVGLRPGAKSAGRATDPLPATRLSSTLQLIAYKSLYLR